MIETLPIALLSAVFGLLWGYVIAALYYSGKAHEKYWEVKYRRLHNKYRERSWIREINREADRTISSSADEETRARVSNARMTRRGQ